MDYLIYIIAAVIVLAYARFLYLQDCKGKKIYEDGDPIGYQDYYVCTPNDIIVLESQLWIQETICEEIN